MRKACMAVTMGVSVWAGAAAGATGSEAGGAADAAFSVQAFWESGALRKGLYQAGVTQSVVKDFDWVDHFGAFLYREGAVGDRLYLSGGLGGIFEFRKPEIVNAGFTGHQRRAFFAGPARAEAEYRFGDPAHPYLSIASGMFAYKYDPDAADLGEYLFRSLPYPTVLSTGGYSVLNSAAANLQGFKAEASLGSFRADLLAITETSLPPLYDWSLAAVASYAFGNGWLEVGAGINAKRLIPVRPSRTARREAGNAWFTYGGRAYSGNPEYYQQQADFYKKAGNPDAEARARADFDVVDSLTRLPPGDPGSPSLHYYSAAGTLLMARASFDPKLLLGLSAGAAGGLGPEDGKLYAEAALLGVENRPVFYERRLERMPMMFGFNLPAFGWLDRVALEAEYLDSPWLGNTALIAEKNYNTPYFPNASDANLSSASYGDLAAKDDWKWSILIRKKLGSKITLTAQAASDHLRLASSRFYYGPQFDHNEVTAGPGYWYGMAQVAWGL